SNGRASEVELSNRIFATSVLLCAVLLLLFVCCFALGFGAPCPRFDSLRPSLEGAQLWLCDIIATQAHEITAGYSISVLPFVYYVSGLRLDGVEHVSPGCMARDCVLGRLLRPTNGKSLRCGERTEANGLVFG